MINLNVGCYYVDKTGKTLKCVEYVGEGVNYPFVLEDNNGDQEEYTRGGMYDIFHNTSLRNIYRLAYPNEIIDYNTQYSNHDLYFEVGNFYTNSRGDIWYCTEITDDDIYPICVTDSLGFSDTVTTSGKFCTDDENDDPSILTKEVPQPKFSLKEGLAIGDWFIDEEGAFWQCNDLVDYKYDWPFMYGFRDPAGVITYFNYNGVTNEGSMDLNLVEAASKPPVITPKQLEWFIGTNYRTWDGERVTLEEIYEDLETLTFSDGVDRDFHGRVAIDFEGYHVNDIEDYWECKGSDVAGHVKRNPDGSAIFIPTSDSLNLDTSKSENTVKEDNFKMDMNKFFGGPIGKVNTPTIKLTMSGLAVAENGNYVALVDGQLQEVMEEMTMPSKDMVFFMPVQKDQLKPGDLICNYGGGLTDRFLFVEELTKTAVVALNPLNRKQETLVGVNNFFGSKWFIKVVSIMNMGNFMQDGDSTMNPMFMMAMMGGDQNNDMFKMMAMSQMMQGGPPTAMGGMNPMMLMMMMGGNMDPMMLMMMAQQSGQNPFAQMFPVSPPTEPTKPKNNKK